MKRNYTWGTLNELIMLGILARIHVSYINSGDPDPSKWVILTYTMKLLLVCLMIPYMKESHYIFCFIPSIILEVRTIMMQYTGFNSIHY